MLKGHGRWASQNASEESCPCVPAISPSPPKGIYVRVVVRKVATCPPRVLYAIWPSSRRPTSPAPTIIYFPWRISPNGRWVLRVRAVLGVVRKGGQKAGNVPAVRKCIVMPATRTSTTPYTIVSAVSFCPSKRRVVIIYKVNGLSGWWCLDGFAVGGDPISLGVDDFPFIGQHNPFL